MARSPTETLDLPVLPLRDVVVFPHMVIPLFVGRDKSMHALEQAMEADKRILLLAQKSAETDDPSAADLYQVGTLAQVLQLLKLPDGTIKVLVEGLSRVNVTQVTERDGALHGVGEEIESDESREPREIEAIARSLMSLTLTRAVPSTRTLMVPSGNLSNCSTWASAPTVYRSAAAGSSVSADFCASNRMRLSDSIACSSARMDLSRPTNSGITMCGNTTTSRNGNTGRSRRWESERAMGAPADGGQGGAKRHGPVMGPSTQGCK